MILLIEVLIIFAVMFLLLLRIHGLERRIEALEARMGEPDRDVPEPRP